MKEMKLIGKTIKDKRLSLNLTMGQVSEMSGITRCTLYSIEKGDDKVSIANVIKVLNVLGLSLSLDSSGIHKTRKRATRVNSKLDKKINHFIVMTIEEYASSVGKSGSEIYRELMKRDLIRNFESDYEDLHGFSTMYLNGYIDDLLKLKA